MKKQNTKNGKTLTSEEIEFSAFTLIGCIFGSIIILIIGLLSQ